MKVKKKAEILDIKSPEETKDEAEIIELEIKPTLIESSTLPLELNGQNEKLNGKTETGEELKKDSLQQYLAKTYRRNCRITEKFALNFISQEIQHPVISCFRELSKSDVNFIISKYKKLNTEMEQVISLLGLLDYIAVSINNPLYQDNFSLNFKRTFPACVDKLMIILKVFIVNFASSEKESTRRQHEMIVAYLKNLVSHFNRDEYGKSYLSMLEIIDNEVTRARENQEKLKSNHSFLFGYENQDGTRKENKKMRKKREKTKLDIPQLTEEMNSKISVLPLRENENLSLIARKRSLEKEKEIKEVVPLKIPKIEEEVDKKPKNAFAILMNRSREMWKKKDK